MKLAVTDARRAIKAANAALGAMLFLAILLAVRDVTSTIFAPREKPASEAKKQAVEPQRQFQDYAPILGKNPFGFQAGELRQLTAQAGGAQVSATDVTLIGTVAGSPRVSYAIFTDKSGQQEVFGIGDMVFGAGTLKKVLKDMAIISANGKEVEVPIADIAATTVELGKAREAASVPAASFARKTGDSAFVLDQRRIQAALENPQQIMTHARFQPHTADGKQQGFMLTEVRPGGIYQSLGLQNGDVLLRINEFAITNPETALQAFTALKGMDRIQLDIMRGGSKMTLTYQIR